MCQCAHAVVFVLLALLALLALVACDPSPDTGGVDGDGDGSLAWEDCDDGDPAIHPAAEEVCNDVDDDCDGSVDEELRSEFWLDGDEDGYGGPYVPIEACEQPVGYSALEGDCDDQDPNVSPGAEELCNGEDDNCDGVADDGQVTVWYEDADGDGYGNPDVFVDDCDGPSGWLVDGTDCDDTDPAINPGATEECDNDDDNCDGRSDLGETSIWYSDDDGDGYGHPAEYENTCDPPEGWVQEGGDCDPADPEENPGQPEECDEVDQDCDGEIDEDFDLDGDGYMSDECEYIDSEDADCDDDDFDIHPLQFEICDDGIDQNCDGRDTFCGYSGSYDLASPDAKYYAPSASDDAGRLVEVGDVDGDGRDDMLTATLYSSGYAGGAYLALGPLSGTQSLGTAGFHLESDRSCCYGAGRSIGLGDTNGDGYDDIVIGSPWADTPGSRVLLGPITADVTLQDDAVAFLYGSPSTYTGHGSDMADVDGDGLADAVIGAYYTNGAAGTGYIVYGPVTADVNLETAADATLECPSSGSYMGRVMRAGGDLDGDGIGDVLSPAPYSSIGGYYSGAVYVILMPVYGTIDLSSADGTLVGEGSSSYAGSVLAMNDVNGDGLDDAVVGAYGTSSSVSGGGAAYVVYGPATGEWDLGSADVVVNGSYPSHYLGSGVAADDVDADGYAELFVGAYGDSTGGSGSGGAFLFFGPLSGTYASTDADASFVGEDAGDNAGYATRIGDLDADGWGDLLLGATGDNTGGGSAGAVFVQYPE